MAELDGELNVSTKVYRVATPFIFYVVQMLYRLRSQIRHDVWDKTDSVRFGGDNLL